MIQSVFIPHRLPSLNDYIKVERGNRFAAAKVKKEYTELIRTYALKLKPFTEPVWINCVWHEPSTAMDLDNRYFSVKFLLDGIKEAGVLPDDSQKWVKAITNDIEIVKKKDVGVLVQIGEY